MNLFLFLGVIFLMIFLIGRFIEKLRVPWIFAALIIGSFLAIYNPLPDVTSSGIFEFLATLGMYFLLFMIGFEIDLDKLKKRGRFIAKSAAFIILLEGIAGSILIHYLFGYSWIISFIVSMSFATVGEAILIPILDEFKIVNTKLGQSVIGIGTFDDIIEIILLVIVGLWIGKIAGNQDMQFPLVIFSLIVLFALTAGFLALKEKGRKFSIHNIETLFFIVLAVLFVFLGIGEIAESGPLAALLSGIAVKTFIPKKRLELIEKEIKALSYGFFAPLFFLLVGISLDIKYLVSFPLFILAVVIVSNGVKITGSYLMAKKELGVKGSLLLGVGLSARFSTSLIIIKLLLDSGIVGKDIYSVIVASSILFTFIVPFLFSRLLVRWKSSVMRQRKV